MPIATDSVAVRERKSEFAAFAGLLLLSLSIPCGAQNANLGPNFGPIDLVSGFEPDPAEYELYAGGTIDLSLDADLDCIGFISAAPDFRITYSEAEYDYPLGFLSDSEADTVLLILGPDDRWYCNDDFSEEFGFNAGLEFAVPQEGYFDIWVGVYDIEDIYTPATLLVSELGLSPETSSSDGDPGSTTDDRLGSGTAFAINDQGHLLTNHHVIEDCNSLTFQLPGQNPVPASVVASNEAMDLALLSADLLTVPASMDLQTRLRLGDEVVVYGFPLLGDLSSQGNLTTGVVSALTGLNDDRANFQISAQIQPGNSGGPVINRSGEVVGVVVSMADDRYFSRQSGVNPQNVNFAIAGKVILTFLNSNGVSYSEASDGQQFLSIVDIAERAQAYTGAVMCYGE